MKINRLRKLVGVSGFVLVFGIALWAVGGLLVITFLSGCAPRGAKNWPFSIGPQTYAVALGDLDGDGDLDALVGNRQNAEVWLNAGGAQGGAPGQFAQARWQGSLDSIRALFLRDLDGDGDLDALAVGGDAAVVWLNDGQADFSTGAQIGFEPQHALAIGDLNNDGAPDIFAGSVNHGILIWLNDGRGGFAPNTNIKSGIKNGGRSMTPRANHKSLDVGGQAWIHELLQERLRLAIRSPSSGCWKPRSMPLSMPNLTNAHLTGVTIAMGPTSEI